MYPSMDKRKEQDRQQDLFETIRTNMAKNLTEEQRAELKLLGEKFHESFDVTRGTIHDLNTIDIEESLAYVVETLKSGIHPDYLNEDERALVSAAYGEHWYKKWGYEETDLEKK